MCNGNVFLARKKAETHFDCSCAVEIAFFLRGEKSRETCGLVMCNGNVFLARKKAETHFDCSCAVEIAFFFCERRKKQRNVWIDHVQWTFVFLREKSKETSTSIMCSGIFLRGNAWFDHAQWTFVFWQKTCGFSMCWMLPHPWLFSNHSVRDGTIGAPIKYGKLDASSQ